MPAGPEGCHEGMAVYLIDDDDAVREALAFLLVSCGHVCIGYSSGDLFLAELAALAPGCILLDVRMAGVTGFELLARLRWLDLDWPKIVMTGLGGSGVRQEALTLGAVAFLEKPFDDVQLKAALARAHRELRQSAGAC